MTNETKLVNVADTTYHSSLYEFLDVAKLLEFEIGFENSYYFSKVFKSFEGCSPREYIKKHNK